MDIDNVNKADHEDVYSCEGDTSAEGGSILIHNISLLVEGMYNMVKGKEYIRERVRKDASQANGLSSKVNSVISVHRLRRTNVKPALKNAYIEKEKCSRNWQKLELPKQRILSPTSTAGQSSTEVCSSVVQHLN